MIPTLVLASASPRRRELLAQFDVEFVVEASDVPEISRAGELPAEFAQRVARDKALAVSKRHAGCFVLGADTVVVLDGVIFGKPADREDARRMLTALSGSDHSVITAVALVDPHGRVEQLVVETRVAFRALTAAEIEDYLESGEPFDKAGAYAVQGLGGRFVVKVQGSHSNVVGLPMEATMALLDRRGVIARRSP